MNLKVTLPRSYKATLLYSSTRTQCLMKSKPFNFPVIIRNFHVTSNKFQHSTSSKHICTICKNLPTEALNISCLLTICLHHRNFFKLIFAFLGYLQHFGRLTMNESIFSCSDVELIGHSIFRLFQVC